MAQEFIGNIVSNLQSSSCGLLFAAALICASPQAAEAQALDLGLGIGLGSGASMAPGEGAAVLHGTPIFVEFEVDGVLDHDFLWEYVLAINVPLQQTPAFGMTPQLRRIMPLSEQLNAHFSFGVPIFISPYTLLGFEMAGGVRYKLRKRLELIGSLQMDAFFVGSDVPVGGMLTMFNLLFGVRFPI